MKKIHTKRFLVSFCLLASFVFWTLAVLLFDVQAIGPRGSAVGFATINRFIHDLTGVHFALYNVTDWLGLVPIAVCLGFAVLGLVQWITRKSILKVDRSILILGGFYLVVIAAYLLFEKVVINYRPVLINNVLEVSYPSSTTLLVLCVMPTALSQFRTRIKNQPLKKGVSLVIIAFMFFMVVGRLVSGVHWFTDIVGSVLLCSALVSLYHAFLGQVCAPKKAHQSFD